MQIAKYGISLENKDKNTNFSCYKTYFPQTFRIFAVLIEKTIKDV